MSVAAIASGYGLPGDGGKTPFQGPELAEQSAVIIAINDELDKSDVDLPIQKFMTDETLGQCRA